MKELSSYDMDYFDVKETHGVVAKKVRNALISEIEERLDTERYKVRLTECWMPWKRMFEVGIAIELSSKNVVMGIDIGGTEIKGALVDTDGFYYKKFSVPTYANEGRDTIIKQIKCLYDNLNETAKNDNIIINGVGIGTAGRVDITKGKVIFATDNLPGWHGLELQERLSDFIDYPMIIDNDANVALLGERWIGAGKGSIACAMLTLGTGVGGGIYINGDVVRGSRYEGAELGHLIIHANGRPCNCGKLGCVEQYLSGKALIKSANESGLNINHGRELFDLYEEKNEISIRIIDQFLDDFVITLSIINSFVNPERIIIGGGIIDSSDVWWTELEKRFSEVKLVKAKLKNNAGFIGAAKLFMDSKN